MVDHRTQQNPNDLDYYYFVQPPAERTSSNPKGIHIDGMMMPKRDIADSQDGTDTWKILRGEDVTFFAESAWERRYAAHQFDGTFVAREQHMDEPYPTSTPVQRVADGKIDGYLWQYQIGNLGGATSSGIGDCYYHNFLNISQSSDLHDSYLEWPNGDEIERTVDVQTDPPTQDFSASHPYWAMGGFTLPQTMSEYDVKMVSSVDDFATGSPLYADSVRKAYYDLRRLRFYTLRCPSLIGDGDYERQLKSSTWRIAAHAEQELDPPTVPSHLPNSQYVLYDDGYYFSTDPVQKAWYQCEPTSGTFRLPYCGKYGRGQGYKSQMYGNEVACYVALEMEWCNQDTDWGNKIRVGFYKVPYTVRTDIGKVDVNYSSVVNAAKSFANHYNARVNSFSESHEHLKYCHVEISDIFTVCQIHSRTDISSLNWDWDSD